MLFKKELHIKKSQLKGGKKMKKKVLAILLSAAMVISMADRKSVV